MFSSIHPKCINREESLEATSAGPQIISSLMS